MLSYGYRSKCCYSTIHVGFKRIKNSNLKVKIWICNKCKKRDVDIVEYNKNDPTGASLIKQVNRKFAETDEIDGPQTPED